MGGFPHNLRGAGASGHNGLREVPPLLNVSPLFSPLLVPISVFQEHLWFFVDYMHHLGGVRVWVCLCVCV